MRILDKVHLFMLYDSCFESFVLLVMQRSKKALELEPNLTQVEKNLKISQISTFLVQKDVVRPNQTQKIDFWGQNTSKQPLTCSKLKFFVEKIYFELFLAVLCSLCKTTPFPETTRISKKCKFQNSV